MDKEQVIELVRQYKVLVSELFGNFKIYLYGSYSKGNARQESDIDVAVVVPVLEGDWWTASTSLWTATRKVSTLIEPVLIEESHPSPLYADVLATGMII